MRIKVTFFVLILTSDFLLLPPSALANSIYNRSPWPEAYKGLTFEKDNTDFEDAAHPCFTTAGRSFKVSHKDSFKLVGLSVYVYVPNRQEPRFSPDLLRLSFLDQNSQRLVSKASPAYSAVISRDGNAQPIFEVYFPLNLNVAGGVTYTANLECLTDEDLLRLVESSRVGDGLTEYYDSTTGRASPYYMSGRKVLFTTFSEWLSPHFPSLTTSSPIASATGGPPKYHPVIFVHGLGGTPGAFDGREDQSRNYVKLLTDLGYPSDYISLYSYGYKEDGRGGTYYNYQGDIREIAQGLEVVVNSLSDRHKSAGGDGKVDIVAHSLGNLVTRQYLLTHKDNHKIRRYVGIGAPFKGAWVMGVDKGIRSFPLVGSTIEKGLSNFFFELINRGRERKLDKSSIVYTQLAPESDYLEGQNGINKTIINGVDVYAVYGDINGTLRQRIFSRTFERKIDIGDGLILAKSAGYTDWAANSRKYAFNDKLIIDLKFNHSGSVLAAEFQVSDLTQVKSLHTDLLSNANSKGKIICILSNDNADGC